MSKFATLALAMLLAPLAVSAEEAAATASAAAGEEAKALDWADWKAGNDVRDAASLQRGARNFMNYCSGCHSLKYLRYSRLGEDLHISDAQLKDYLVVGNAKTTDYITSSLATADGENWFGKAPPDLSLIARSRGTDYLYRFLKTFYVDASRPTGTNNLALASAAMPAVLSELEGVKSAVYRNVEVTSGGKTTTEKELVGFETIAPGAMTPAEFDGFVRDTVNFLDYAGEPAQVARRSIGVWVVLFLLVFTWLAWLLKKEYWKDVH
ncbi:MAG: cytochrome c1 [Steroidobacteraceae bacterium]